VWRVVPNIVLRWPDSDTARENAFAIRSTDELAGSRAGEGSCTKTGYRLEVMCWLHEGPRYCPSYRLEKEPSFPLAIVSKRHRPQMLVAVLSKPTYRLWVMKRS
jgi:hypothetical protein